ncbi:phosphoribosylanthranilate isomerase [Natronocalculus amylovorans]|uniref:N-(5'-phosphoribosyl)anthranilate isomerase n=1 Tax=Natronocalculus amylovorans TaxID=2917812 RepID=A0AAE3FVY8_9EURY|nr:phosphoribosylanthranilate isomerase [Natronocalculus amylovorans]MCL9816592.1 phosphoribosylanthranilate isomerase [Natronocalculus amylovorans]NUE01036.1 phosphoribosylanthranilate isomerase [Halorubraceae archaeon YAN]
MARVKICGLTDSADLRAAVEAGTDAVGFISEVPVDTPREVDRSQAAALIAETPPFVTATLVTMAETPEEAVSIVRTTRPDALQLHGSFDSEELGFIRAETGIKLIQTIDHTETDRAAELDQVVDALLIDSTDESGAGGTGETHDWAATGELVESLTSPVILAGGLTPDNVAEAVSIAAPFGVDVASGVEAEGGIKDHTAVATFIQNAGRELEVRQL